MLKGVNKNTLGKMTNYAKIKIIAEETGTEIFYQADKNSMPDKVKNSISSLNKIWIGSASYFPVYIGFSDAAMMISQKEFSKAGDIVQNFAGNTVIIAGILPETKTILDQMHFVGPEFEIKN